MTFILSTDDPTIVLKKQGNENLSVSELCFCLASAHKELLWYFRKINILQSHPSDLLQI